MTDNDSPLHFYLDNNRLYCGSEEHGFLEVTKVLRQDRNGVEYLEFLVSDNKVSAEYFVKDPLFTMDRGADGQLEGERPGGYYYAWIYQEDGG